MRKRKKINYENIQDLVVEEAISQEVESQVDAGLPNLEDVLSEVTHETNTQDYVCEERTEETTINQDGPDDSISIWNIWSTTNASEKKARKRASRQRHRRRKRIRKMSLTNLWTTKPLTSASHSVMNGKPISQVNK